MSVDVTSVPSDRGAPVFSRTIKQLCEIDQQLRAKAEETRVPWIKRPKADTTFGVVILANALWMGLDLEFGGDDFNIWFWLVECVFLLIFVIEVVLRLHAERPKYRAFFDSWGCFDMSVTVLGVADAWILTPIASSGGENPLKSVGVLRMFRLVRLVRLVRVLRMFSELVVLVKTIGNSLRAVAWMSLLLGMIMYTGSIATVMLLGKPYKDDPKIYEHFGNLGNALFSHFCLVTLEGWPDIATSAMEISGFWSLYFVAMIVLTNFALVNLMVGVIVERIISLSLEQERELNLFVAESEQFQRTLVVLFQHADMDSSGTVTKAELRDLMQMRATRDILSAFGINVNIPQEMLFTIMDLNGEGETSFKDFYNACMRMCGSNQTVHSVFLQYDICELHNDFNRGVQRLEAHLQHLEGGSSETSSAFGRHPPERGPAAGVGTNASPPPPVLTGPPGSAEAALGELLERMDRFGKVQEEIFAEMHALRECRSLLEGEPPGGAVAGASADAAGDGVVAVQSSRPRATVLEAKGGKEVGPCCISPFFGGPTPSDQHLRAKQRKELEAEFRRWQER